MLKLSYGIKNNRKGEVYWYVNNKKSISKTKNKKTKVDKIRLDNSNYFDTYEDAFDYLID